MKTPKHHKKKNNRNKRRRQHLRQQRHSIKPTIADRTIAVPLKNTHSSTADDPRPVLAGQTADYRRLAAVLFGTGLLTLWFAQNSVNSYWQQTYHRTSPIQNWSAFTPWRTGSLLRDTLESPLGKLSGWRADGIRLPENPPTPTVADKHDTPPTDSTPIDSTTETPHTDAADAPVITLKDGDMILFAGDSMMESIAPHSQRFLQREYGISSINLSRQSTGLSYPKNFDWPATIEEQLAQYSRIRVVAVFLGPNDPWDFPDPQGGTGYLKFQSPEWEHEYRSRVRRIADAAEHKGVRLVWLEIPPMKNTRLHEQTRYLNRIIADELHGRALWLSTAAPSGAAADGRYGENVEHQGQTVRVRSKDGIHFTLKGQQILAAHLNSHFNYQSSPTTIPHKD